MATEYLSMVPIFDKLQDLTRDRKFEVQTERQKLNMGSALGHVSPADLLRMVFAR